MKCSRQILKIAMLVVGVLGLSFQVNSANVPSNIELAKDQTLVKGNGSEPASLDPNKAEGVPEANVLRDLFEGLVITGPTGEILPGAATSWETQDNKTYIFHIRENAKWSNGFPVTADDFVFSFRRAVDPKTASKYSWYFEMTTMHNATDIINGKKSPDTLGVKAIDHKTLEFTLDTPVPYFVGMLSHTSTLPVPKAAIEKFGDKWTRAENMVSNGAYQMDSWVVNEKIVVKRNENYWDNKNTVIDKVTFLPIVSHNSDMNRFLSDEVHITYEMPVEFFKSLSKSNSDEVKVTGYIGTYYYQFNFRRKPFDDVRVRKALSYAIDRDIIANYVMGQGQKPAYSLTPSIVDGFTPDVPSWAKLSQKVRDVEAKKLLKEAGYDDANPLTLELLYNTNENHKKMAIAISSMWKKALGVKVELVNQEWKTYLDSKTQGNFDIARAGWIADYNEASSMLDLMQSTHGQNNGKYSNALFDEKMTASRTIMDPVERGKLYQQAEEILAEDFPIAPIYQYVQARLVKSYLGGYPNNPLDHIYSKDLYMINQ